MSKKLSLISFIFFCFIQNVFSAFYLTDEEYKKVITRLEKDKKIISDNQKKWDTLRKTDPKIIYDVKDDGVVEQSITIPVLNDEPLEYNIKFKIEKKDTDKIFPMTLFLCGMMETKNLVDCKVGMQIFNFSCLNISALERLRFNVLCGVRSGGISLSYNLSKPFKNTNIHLYSGTAYTLDVVFGVGISLDF